MGETSDGRDQRILAQPESSHEVFLPVGIIDGGTGMLVVVVVGSFSRLKTCASLSMHTYCWNALAVAYFGENLDINALSISVRKAKEA